MCTQSECKQVTVTVNLNDCGNETPSKGSCEPCLLVPYGKNIIFRNEANQGSESKEALDGEIFIGYHNGLWGTYKRINATTVEILTQEKNS